LTNFYVSENLIHQAEAQIQDIVKSGHFLDLSHLIPPPFTDDDIKDFVKLVGDQCRLLGNNSHLCTEKFIKKCLDSLKPLSEELVIKKIKSGIKP